ncbi:MAG: hypothetical protein GX446_01750 [Chthonomonadales bacterium]|nr:hypothetical protein [Chthonomonadales bacterium]
MKRVRLTHLCSITLVSPLLAIACLAPAFAQGDGLWGGVQPPKGPPFVSTTAPMPREVTAKPVKQTRAETTKATIVITPKTPLVTDGAPFWTQDENSVYFHSNRSNLAGSAAGTLYHIYRMTPAGAAVVAITGPLSQGKVGESTSQTEPAANAAGNKIVYVETAGGSVDIVELDLGTRTTRSLVKNNADGYSFVALSGPQYGVWAGANIAVLFAGRTTAGGPFKIYAVDTQSGRVQQVTTGVSDDRNPTLSPAVGTSQMNSVIAFDSNRSNPQGSAVKATRDIWVIPADRPAPATRVTNFGVGGSQSSNIEPSWSTNKLDTSGFVNGQQLIAFASTRLDTANDGNANAVSSSDVHDIYWLKVTIAQGPDGWLTVTTPESGANAAFKLPTGDPGHVYDDRKPVWPQFIGSYRVIFQSNRTSFDPVNQVSQPANPTPTTPTDIFASTLMDLNAPTLVRFDETSGEVVRVEPRLAIPGTPVRISVKVADLETGVRDVWVQIKNPNSKYQSADGVEHKVYVGAGLNLDQNNVALSVPVEYEAQRIFIGNDPSDPRVNTYANPRYVASQADFWAFTGGNNPPDASWLKLSFESRDPVTGVQTYAATWTTPTTPSDYHIDVIVYDNAVDPFSGDTINWKIYDNVWGFSTQPFQAGRGILFVSDYAAGQKFFASRFGEAALVNVRHTFWGTESWMTDIDVNLLPRSYQNNTTIGSLVNVLNALGVKSYGAFDPRDPFTARGADSDLWDGTVVDGVDVPSTQQYDIWRILCRGPVPDSVLAQYLPHTAQQPPDVIAGETTPRTVTVAPRCVIWHAPYTGNVFAGPGTLTDLATQTQLTGFLNAGGRLLVNGQDIGWALTLDGATSNTFLTNALKAQYVRDDAGFTYFRVGGGGFGIFFGISSAYALTPAGAYNPISHDPWVNIPGTFLSSQHVYPGPPEPPGNFHPISAATNYVAAGSDSNNPRALACPGNFYPDVVNSLTGAVPVLTYGGGGTAVHYYLDPATGSRLVYSPMGLEGLFPDWWSPANTQNTIALKNRRSELFHNFVCWARTGTITGTVLDVENAGAPLSNALVRLSNRQSGSQLVTAYTAMTADDGSFFINGVEPAAYEISAMKPGYTIQKRTGVVVHGAARDDISFRMTKAEPAVVTGKVTRLDGTTPVVGATVTLTDVLPPNATFTATTDANGDYTISRVPSQTTYTLTCTAVGYGESIPVSYPVPNPNDPIQGQRDTVLQPAKVYTGFNFKLKAEQGGATGRVLAEATDQPIAGATVTATQGTTNVTAITDANGNYSFSKNNTPPNGLDPGSWGFVAAAAGYSPSAPQTVTVNSNETATVPTIKLATIPPGSISGLVTRTSDGVAQAGVRVEVRDPAGNLVAEGTTTTAVSSGGYTYNYKLEDVPAGVTYTVMVSAQGFTPVPASRQAKVDSQTETRNVNFQMEPLHTFSGSLTLVSTPYDYSAVDAGDLLSIPPADRTNGSFLLATWDLQRYRYYPQAGVNSFRSGRGYFMAYKNNIPLSQEGTVADTSRPFDIPLNVGWNLIGNPFLFDLDWTKSFVVDGGSVKPFNDAIATGAIGSALYTYVSGSYILDYKIAPWRGYWVRAYRNVTLRLDPVIGRYGRAAQSATSRAVLRGAQGWSVNLIAEAGGLRDAGNQFGVATGAAEGFDAYKGEKPPAFGDRFVRVTFDHADWGDRSGGYGVDIRSASNTPRVWEFTVTTAGVGGTATLTWPDIATAGRNAALTLVDVATGVQRDMRSSSGYSWQTDGAVSERKFRIEMAMLDRSALRITDARATQNGRGSGAEISFVTSTAATVTVRILSSSGAVVRTLPAGTSRAAGQQQVRWDQRDSRGITMPAGAYRVEIRAQTPDGKQTARALTQIILTR